MQGNTRSKSVQNNTKNYLLIKIMRILFATPYKCISGGISRWAENIINYYNGLETDVELDVLPMNDTKERSAEDFVGNSTIRRVARGLRTYGYALRTLRRKLEGAKYDILHIASSASISLLKDIVMMRIAHKRGVKSVLHFHFGRIPELAKKQNWEWKMLLYAVKLSDKTVVIDRQSYETLMSKDCYNVEYVPNPLAPVIGDIISKMDVERKSNMLLFVGQCLPTKGVYELVDACGSISNIELWMLGAITDDMSQELTTRWNGSSKLYIAGNLSFEEVIRMMCKCDVFILPTYTEGFPNVILEGMACGCAIVTTPVGAIPEILGDEDGNPYGLMVEPRNVEQLRDAINKMLSDDVFKETCRKNAQQRVNERYNMNSVWQQMVRVWRSI